MDFEDICQIVDTVVDLPVHSKPALLHDLAHRAALVLKVDDDTVFSALLKREELGSTGVGNGVALPHVRLEQVKKPFGILARLKQPISYRPEAHYMRGPGPKWRAKRAQVSARGDLRPIP
jgi:PTS system nitrogen regulatory IIA component